MEHVKIYNCEFCSGDYINCGHAGLESYVSAYNALNGYYLNVGERLVRISILKDNVKDNMIFDNLAAAPSKLFNSS